MHWPRDFMGMFYFADSLVDNQNDVLLPCRVLGRWRRSQSEAVVVILHGDIGVIFIRWVPICKILFGLPLLTEIQYVF